MPDNTKLNARVARIDDLAKQFAREFDAFREGQTASVYTLSTFEEWVFRKLAAIQAMAEDIGARQLHILEAMAGTQYSSCPE